MSGQNWRRSTKCESSSCAEWYVDDAGALHVRDSDSPTAEVVLPRAAALVFVDAARRGEVYPFGQTAGQPA